MVKYKHIEGAREVRLWIRDILVPTALAVGLIISQYPEIPGKVKSKVNSIMESVKDGFKREA